MSPAVIAAPRYRRRRRPRKCASVSARRGRGRADRDDGEVAQPWHRADTRAVLALPDCVFPAPRKRNPSRSAMWLSDGLSLARASRTKHGRVKRRPPRSGERRALGDPQGPSGQSPEDTHALSQKQPPGAWPPHASLSRQRSGSLPQSWSKVGAAIAEAHARVITLAGLRTVEVAARLRQVSPGGSGGSRMLTPGAKMPIHGPSFENEATASLSSVAPAVRAAGALAGERLQGLAFSLPAAQRTACPRGPRWSPRRRQPARSRRRGSCWPRTGFRWRTG